MPTNVVKLTWWGLFAVLLVGCRHQMAPCPLRRNYSATCRDSTGPRGPLSGSALADFLALLHGAVWQFRTPRIETHPPIAHEPQCDADRDDSGET